MLIETYAQFIQIRRSRGFSGRHGNIDRRQRVLVQAKGFACETLDAVARYGGPEGARCDAQSQPRMGGLVGQNRQAKKCIGKFFAAPLYVTKFGRLMQTLARLERQFTDLKEP